MLKKYKKTIIISLIVFALSIIMCMGFIKMHYTVDTYTIANIGYLEYATNWSLKDGRILMYILLLLMNILKVPLEITNYIFEIAAIIISTVSVMIIYNMVIKIKDTDSKMMKSILLVISYLVVFNFMYVEALYFLESIIISTSILLFILATKNLLKETKKGLIKAGLLAIIAMFAYQGTIGFFIVLSISMIIIKKQKIDKELLKYILYIGIITFIAVLVNLIAVKQINNYFGTNNARLRLQNIVSNILYIVYNMGFILTNTCGLLPRYFFLGITIFLILISIIYIILKKENILHITNIMIILVVAIIGSFVVFIATKASFDCGRMYMGIGSLPMLIIIYLYTATNIFNSKIFRTTLYAYCLIILIFTFFDYTILMQDVQYKNKLEKEYCNNINDFIKENDINIKKATVICVPGKRNEIYFEQIKRKNKLTINEVRGYAGAIPAINVYTNLDLEKIDASKTMQDEYIKRIQEGNKGINDTYSMIIDDVLILPAFIW